MPGHPEIPKGPVFFTPDAPAAYKRRRILFALLVLLCSLSTIWPLYPLFSKTYPLVFSLPFSLAWLVILLLVTMAGLTWLYRADNKSS